jgi:hypothetical protein
LKVCFKINLSLQARDLVGRFLGKEVSPSNLAEVLINEIDIHQKQFEKLKF